MSTCWAKCKLRDLIRIHYGKSLKESERVSTGSVSVYGSSGQTGYHNRKLFEYPSLVIGRKGSVGAITMAPDGGWVIDTAFFIEIIDQESIDLHYLFYALKNARLVQHVITTSIPGLNRDTIYSAMISLPPLSEQKRIAAILDKTDELRRKRREAIAKLNTLIQSIFLDMFGDPMKNSKQWKVTKLGEVGILDRGKSKHRPRNDPKLLGGPYPLIQTGDIANSGGQITRYTQTYSELGLQQSRMWPKGTLCITIAANIAKTGILTFEACFPDSVVGFHPGNSVRTEYVQYWLSFLQASLEATAPESAQKNINLDILRKLSVPLPPVELQDQFVNQLHNILDLKETLDQSSGHLQTLSSSIQQKVFLESEM